MSRHHLKEVSDVVEGLVPTVNVPATAIAATNKDTTVGVMEDTNFVRVGLRPISGAEVRAVAVIIEHKSYGSTTNETR